MVQLVLAFVLALLFLLALAVRRVYYCVPAKELKRLARAHDRIGASLYKAVAFDGSLAILLWFLIGVFAASSFALFMAVLAWPLAGLSIAVVLWLGFGWVATAFPSSFMVRFTAAASPGLAWTLHHTHAVLAPMSDVIRNYHHTSEHTGLYEKQALTELFGRQKAQLDSRVAPEEIELMERVLSFGEKTVGEVAAPRQNVRLVRLGETIGPKLMDELHHSGQQLFPVCDDKSDRVIGLVRLEDLVKARHGGRVKSVATESVYFVRDDFLLAHVLEVFLRTSQQLLVVINNFEEFVGVVTLENLLEQLTGKQPSDAVENVYGDRAAVAQYQPAEPEPVADPELESEETDSEVEPSETSHKPTELPEQSEPAPQSEKNQENATPEDPEVVE